ncbi:MAG: hypothetical protein J3Q66DRAFT_360459 [Benniella sp.]|nr:MAG: hypothetical protein J3Q66DRAFT_360459 [Benniella sp.]
MSGIVPPPLTTLDPPISTIIPTIPTPPTTFCSPWCPTSSTTAWQPPTSTWEPPPTTWDPPKTTRPQPTRNPTTPPVASTQRPITNSLPGPGVPSQSNPYTPSASISSNLPTTKSDAEGGLTQGAIIGIVIVSLAVVGIIVSFFVIRHTRRRNHKPLYPEGDDFLSHLPIDGPTSPPPMSNKPNYLHNNSGHHYPKDQGGGEYDPMYHQGDYHHGGGDGHHDYYQDQGYVDQGHGYGQDGQYQGFSDQGHGFSDQGQAHHGGGDGYQGYSDQGHGFGDQGQAYSGDGQFDHLNQGHGHQGGGGDGYQGFSDTGHHGGGGDGQFQGFSDQGTTQGGGGQTQVQPQGHGFDQGGANQLGGGTQDPGSQGFSNQGPSGTFQTTPQPTSGPGGSNGLGGGFQNNLPGGNQTGLPDNPFQNIGQGYQSGQPPSQQPGSMSSSGEPPVLPPLAPAPPLINRPKTGSIVRPESSSTYSVLMPSTPSTHSVDLGHIDEAGEDLGYSPRSKQALLDQTRYHDAISTQHPNPRVLSPKIATIPSTQVHEARAPQLRDSEAVGAILTTGNTSSLNTFDRRHPQSHESDSARDSLFFDPSTNVRGPQDL